MPLCRIFGLWFLLTLGVTTALVNGCARGEGLDVGSDAGSSGDVDRDASDGPDSRAGADAEVEASLDARVNGDARVGTDVSASMDADTADDGGPGSDGGGSPMLGGCPVLPSDHVFNTPIDGLPVHSSSPAFMSTIGTRNFHLDLGTTVDQTRADFYGIPYNIVQGDSIPWVEVRYFSADPGLDWDARAEADCAVGNSHTLTSPCTQQAAPAPLFPIPADPLVEGGIESNPSQPYGDHHILMLDSDTCRLWELYHAYPNASGGWDIYGSASFDLRSNALRPAGWTSADAAGFPILPLLLRADEASSGEIRHALRFTIDTHEIRTSYVWPARHLTNNGSSSDALPPMGQLFRIKASYQIPSGFDTQAKAILQAMKTYGMYIADGGSDMYVTGEPSTAWSEQAITQVQSVSNDEVEAVDLSPIMSRVGFDADSARVP